MNIKSLEDITKKYLKEGFLDSVSLAKIKNEFVVTIFGPDTQFDNLSISQQSKIEEAVRELLDVGDGETHSVVEELVENLKHATTEAQFDPTGFSLPEFGKKAKPSPQKVQALRFRTKELIQQLLNAGRPEKKQMAHKMLGKMLRDYPGASPEHQKETLDIVFSLGSATEQSQLLALVKEHPQSLQALFPDFNESPSVAEFDLAVHLAMLLLFSPSKVTPYAQYLETIDSFELITLYNQIFDIFNRPAYVAEQPLNDSLQTWAKVHFLKREPLQQLDVLLYIKSDPQFQHARTFLGLLPPEALPSISAKLKAIAQGDLDSEHTRLHQGKAERILNILEGAPEEKAHPLDPFVDALSVPKFDFDYDKACQESHQHIAQLKALYALLEPTGITNLWPEFEQLMYQCLTQQKSPEDVAPELFAATASHMSHAVARKSLEAMVNLMLSLEDTTMTALETLSRLKKAVQHIEQLKKNLAQLQQDQAQFPPKQLETLIKHYQYKLKYLLGIQKQLKKAHVLMKSKYPPQLNEGIAYTHKTLQKLNSPHAMHRRRDTIMNFGYKIYEPLKPGFQLAMKALGQYESILSKKP